MDLTIAIKKLNGSKSNDSTGINNFIIKKLPLKTKMLLLNLYNKCLTENYLPDDWKTALITMIPKKATNTTTTIDRSAKHHVLLNCLKD